MLTWCDDNDAEDTMKHAIPTWEIPSLAVARSDTAFPVHRIYCVGRNYAEHAREMGGNPEREAPFFFSKPADAVVANGSTIAYPSATKSLHHEIELVVALGKGGENIAPANALDFVFGYAVGIDLTRRDLQAAAKEKARPWDTAKGFDNSAPLTAIHAVSDIGHIKSGAITLTVNGELRQKGDVADMVWPVADIIAHLSSLYRLRAGDLIFTGTPAGVGAVERGDHLVGTVQGLDELSIRIAA
jgi:fumarylpyruvate hydrolase